MKEIRELALCLDQSIPIFIKRTLLQSKVDWDSCIENLPVQDEDTPMDNISRNKIRYQLKKLDVGLAQDILLDCEKKQVHISILGRSTYPVRLTHLDNPPFVFYYKGSGDFNWSKSISIVGTRHATAYGKKVCAELVEGLEGSGITIVSGLAYGIDSYAHTEALRRKLPTWAVLAHGLQTIYPAENRNLSRQIIENGGLLTEYRWDTPVLKWQFPARNRIIAGMTDLTVVVEASLKGGALITARWANQYNREVCAFPGNSAQIYSKGCNHLIKTQQAHLIESAEDLIKIMRWDDIIVRASEQGTGIPSASVLLKFSDFRDEKLYNVLKDRMDWRIAEIQETTLLDFSDLYSRLWSLEEMGLIRILSGNTIKIL